MKTATITLGDQDFTINELPTRKNAAWRARLGEVLGPVVEIIEKTPTIGLPQNWGDVSENPGNTTALIGMVRQIADLLVGGLDDVLTLVLEYSPELEKQADWIKDNAYDSEILAAFTKILGLAYPFGAVVNSLRQLETIGQNQRPISQN